MDLRKQLKENYSGISQNDLKAVVEHTISNNVEITLPTLGFLFEIVWKKSDDNTKEFILNTIVNELT